MSATNKLWRFFAAVAVISIAFSLSFASFMLVMGRADISVGQFLGGIMGGAIFLMPFVLLPALFIAVPVAHLLQAFSWRGWVAYGSVGAITGAAVMLLFALWIAWMFVERFEVWPALFGILPGLAGGLFWWGAVDRYQDRNPWTADA